MCSLRVSPFHIITCNDIRWRCEESVTYSKKYATLRKLYLKSRQTERGIMGPFLNQFLVYTFHLRGASEICEIFDLEWSHDLSIWRDMISSKRVSQITSRGQRETHQLRAQPGGAAENHECHLTASHLTDLLTLIPDIPLLTFHPATSTPVNPSHPLSHHTPSQVPGWVLPTAPTNSQNYIIIW